MSRHSKGKVHLILSVTKDRLSSLLEIQNDINFGSVNTWKQYSFCIIFTLDLAGTKLYRQIVDIQMGTKCAPLVSDLFLFCYEGDLMMSLSDVNQAEIMKAFNSTSRYLDDLLYINNPYFEAGIVNWEGHISSVVLYWLSANMHVAQSSQILEGYL